MSMTDLAGLAAIGFVGLAVVVNLVYVRAGLPLPTSGLRHDQIGDAFAAVGDALKRPSIVAPATWVLTTLFAAGLVSELWPNGAQVTGWALMGFAGVLMQNVTFTGVEALRFGIAAGAAHDRGSVAGLWGFSNVLFGFNQVFLAIAVLGFTVAGTLAGLVPGWHAGLGYVSAGLLFVSASVSPYNADGGNRVGVVGLVGWLGWAGWLVAYGLTLFGL